MLKRPTLGIILGSLLIFMGLLAALSTSRADERAQLPPTLTFTPSPSPIPTFGPSPTPGPSPTTIPSCTPQFNLKAGDYAYVKPGVNVRHQPTTSGGVVGYYTETLLVRITGGPVCADGLAWWQIAGAGNPGWVAEGEGGAIWLTPADTAKLTPVLCAPAMNFTAGQRVRLFNGLRIRNAPGLGGLVLTVAPAESEVIILGGPVCADQYNWWMVQVEVVNFTYTGWMIEGTTDGEKDFVIQAEATPIPCSPPLQLSVGQKAYIYYKDFKPKSLRAAPSLNAPLLYTLVDGVPFIVTGAPVCSEGFNWWPIRVLSNIPAEGWLAEGGSKQLLDSHV